MIQPPKTLNNISGMPQMGAAFAGWMKSITLVTVKESIVDALVIEDRREKTFQGVIQPLGPKQLMLKPEGERAWQWFMIHCISTSLDVDTGDGIEYNGKNYKVMKINDYSLNNYIEYHVVEGFQNE